MKHLWLK